MRKKSRELDLSGSDPAVCGLSPEAASLARNMRVKLVLREEGEGDPLEALVDFLMAVWLRQRARGNVLPGSGPSSPGGGRPEGGGHAAK